MPPTKMGSATPKNDSYAADGYIYCRYRRVKNSDRYLDAHEYGYKAWRIPIKRKRY